MEKEATNFEHYYSTELRRRMEAAYRKMGSAEEDVSKLVDEFNHRVEDTVYYLLEKAVRDEQQAHFIGDLIIPRLEAVASLWWLENGTGAIMSDTQIANRIGDVLVELLNERTNTVVDEVTMDTEYRTSIYNRKNRQYEPLFTTRISALLSEGRALEKAKMRNEQTPDKYAYDTTHPSRIRTEARKVITTERFGPWEKA